VLPTLTASDFPSLPELPETAGVFDAEVFAQAIAQVAIAASKDDSLLKLTGLNVEFDQDKITFAATDRYRLAVKELKWSPADPDIQGSTLVRARTLQEVAKSLSNTNAISLHLSNPNSGHERLIGFNAELKTLVTRTLNESFHAYTHLLTKDWKFEAVVEVAPLLEAARRVALVTDKTVPLKLTFTSNAVLLEASGQDEASAVEEIEAMFSGDSLTIAFNPTYLIEGLQALNYQFVHFDLIDARTHSVLTGQADQYSTKDETYKYLLMPMHYNS
jgi:DNA polymerase-3 subunit beta